METRTGSKATSAGPRSTQANGSACNINPGVSASAKMILLLHCACRQHKFGPVEWLMTRRRLRSPTRRRKDHTLRRATDVMRPLRCRTGEHVDQCPASELDGRCDSTDGSSRHQSVPHLYSTVACHCSTLITNEGHRSQAIRDQKQVHICAD